MAGSLARVRFCAATLLLGTATPAFGGEISVGASAGVGSAFGQTYFPVGVRLGYGIGLGLEADISVEYWTAASPNFAKTSPGLTWYLPVPLLRPYVGGFYSRWFVESGLPNQDSVGVRGGVGLFSLGPVWTGVGINYERRLSCSSDCNTWHPEASVRITF